MKYSLLYFTILSIVHLSVYRYCISKNRRTKRKICLTVVKDWKYNIILIHDWLYSIAYSFSSIENAVIPIMICLKSLNIYLVCLYSIYIYMYLSLHVNYIIMFYIFPRVNFKVYYKNHAIVSTVIWKRIFLMLYN